MAESVLPEKVGPGDARDLPGAVTRVFGDLRGRTDGDVVALCYQADDTVWSVEEAGILRRFDAATGRQIDSLTLSEAETCWAFSSDGRLLASGSNGITVWDVATATPLGQILHSSWLLTITFSPDGRTIASGHDDQVVRLWDASTGKLLHELRSHQEEVCAAAFSADGKLLATAGEDRMVYLWDAKTGKLLRGLQGHTDRVDALAWSASGRRIASAGWDTSVRVWDPQKGELLAMLNGQGECVHSVIFAPDDKSLICGDSECVVRRWDHEKLKVLHEFRRHQGAVKQLALRPDGKRLASGGADRTIQFWNLVDQTPTFDNQGALTQVVSVAVSSQGDLAAVSGVGRVGLWSLASGKPKQPPRLEQAALCVAWSSRGTLAVGDAAGSIHLYDGAMSKPTISWKAHHAQTRLLRFSSQGDILASSQSSDGTIYLHDVTNGQPILLLPEAAGKGTVEAFSFHPNKPWIAAAGINWLGGDEGDGVINVWDYEAKKLVFTLPGGASRVAISPDGKWLAAVSLYESVAIYDLKEGKFAHELSGRDFSVNAIAFDSVHAHLASGSDDCGVRVWESKSWELIASYDLETRIKDVAFSPDGASLITGNGNTACYLVDLDILS